MKNQNPGVRQNQPAAQRRRRRLTGVAHPTTTLFAKKRRRKKMNKSEIHTLDKKLDSPRYIY